MYKMCDRIIESVRKTCTDISCLNTEMVCLVGKRVWRAGEGGYWRDRSHNEYKYYEIQLLTTVR